MKTTEIRISLAHTINLGNYENIRPEISMTVVVEDGDNPAQVFRTLKESCDECLQEIIQAQLRLWPDDGVNQQLSHWKAYYSV